MTNDNEKVSKVDAGFWDKYVLVLFDFDDTLMATATTRWEALIATGNQFGMHVDEPTIKRHWGKPFDQLIDNLFPGLDLAAFLPYYETAMLQFAPSVNPGVSRLLQWLSGHGKRLEILTSSREELIRQDLRIAGLEAYFQKVWDHQQTDPYHKPNPHVFDTLICNWEESNLDIRAVVYIGDSVRDYEAARANSIDFLGVTTGLETKEDFEFAGLPPERVAVTLTQLLPTR